MKIFKNIVKGIFVIILIFFGFIALHNFLGRVIFHNDYPTFLGYGYTSVKKDTFDKHFKVGDLIILKKQEKYKVGDYIIYTKQDEQAIEKVKDTTDTGYITIESDNNMNYEINRGFIRGKVDKVFKLGSFSSFLTSGTGLFVVLFLFILLTFTSKR